MKNTEILQTIIQQIFSSESRCAEQPSDVPLSDRFWVIPGKSGNPRWMLPYDPAIGLPGLQFWEPYDLSSRLKWNAVKTAYRLGGLAHLSGVKLIGVHKQAHFLGIKGWKSAGPMNVVVYIAEPSPRCKAVTFLIEQETLSCRAVAKFPVGALASAKILHESTTLLKLTEEGRTIAPNIMYRDEVAGISIQEVLPVHNTTRKLTSAHIQWLSSLKQQEMTSLDYHCSQLRERFSQVNIPQGVNKQLLDNWLMLSQDSSPIPVAWVHGDFAPWNFKQLPNGRYCAIDWEDATKEGLPFYDLSYYLFVQYYLANKAFCIGEALSMPLVKAYCREFNLSRQQTWRIFRFLLLDFWCKRLEEGGIGLADRVFKYIQPMLGERL